MEILFCMVVLELNILLLLDQSAGISGREIPIRGIGEPMDFCLMRVTIKMDCSGMNGPWAIIQVNVSELDLSALLICPLESL